MIRGGRQASRNAWVAGRIAMDGAILVHRAELKQLQIDFGERRVGSVQIFARSGNNRD